MLGLLIPHGDTITWGGYAYNLSLATLGNIIGGAVFVAGLYWIGSPNVRAAIAADALETENVAAESSLSSAVMATSDRN